MRSQPTAPASSKHRHPGTCPTGRFDSRTPLDLRAPVPSASTHILQCDLESQLRKDIPKQPLQTQNTVAERVARLIVDFVSGRLCMVSVCVILYLLSLHTETICTKWPVHEGNLMYCLKDLSGFHGFSSDSQGFGKGSGNLRIQ